MVTKRHFPQKKLPSCKSQSFVLQGLLPARSACSGDRSHGSGAVRHLRLLARICVPRLQRGGFGELDIPHKLRCLHPKPTGRSHSWPIYCFSKMIMEQTATNASICYRFCLEDEWYECIHWWFALLRKVGNVSVADSSALVQRNYRSLPCVSSRGNFVWRQNTNHRR